MALTDKLSAIGNAIRAKTGGTALLTLDQMPSAINSIETGEGTTVNYKNTIYTGFASNNRITFSFDNNEDWQDGILIFGVVEGTTTTIYRREPHGSYKLYSSTQPAYASTTKNLFFRTGTGSALPWYSESGNSYSFEVAEFISPATKFSPMVIPMVLFQEEVEG